MLSEFRVPGAGPGCGTGAPNKGTCGIVRNLGTCKEASSQTDKHVGSH